jgi:hypothetical protein
MSEQTSVETDKNLSRKIRFFSLALLVVALCLGAWGEISRIMARDALAKDTERDAVPTVNTVSANRSDLGENLVLPGTVQAFVEAPIFARTSGYLKVWYTDIGSEVKKGQLLAELETPEVDQQLAQAEADLETAQANATLSSSTNKRWQGLLETQSVSKQDADEKAGDSAAKKAAVDSAAANVRRLHDLESFKRVAQHRHRGAHQCGPEFGHGTVPHGRHAQAAHLRAGARVLCRGGQAGHAGRTALLGTAQQEVHRDHRSHLERSRSHPAHPAGGIAARQC